MAGLWLLLCYGGRGSRAFWVYDFKWSEEEFWRFLVGLVERVNNNWNKEIDIEVINIYTIGNGCRLCFK